MILSTLKTLLLESKGLDKIWNCFFDLMSPGDFIKKKHNHFRHFKK